MQSWHRFLIISGERWNSGEDITSQTKADLVVLSRVSQKLVQLRNTAPQKALKAVSYSMGFYFVYQRHCSWSAYKFHKIFSFNEKKSILYLPHPPNFLLIRKKLSALLRCQKWKYQCDGVTFINLIKRASCKFTGFIELKQNIVLLLRKITFGGL